MYRRVSVFVVFAFALAGLATSARAAPAPVVEKAAPPRTAQEKQLDALLRYREPAAAAQAIAPQAVFVTSDKHTWLFRPTVWQLVFGKDQELWFHCAGPFRQSDDWDIKVVVSAPQPGDWVKLVDLHRAVTEAGASWYISFEHAKLDVDKDRKSVVFRIDLASGDQTATFTSPNGIAGLTF